MPSTPSRELVITYNGYAVSPDGPVRFSEAFDSESVTFSFNVTGATESAFASACLAAEAAYRDPFNDFTVVQGSATLKSLKHSDGTGLEIMGTIAKDDHVVNTGRSRQYTATIRCGRPADNVATSGLREWSCSVAADPAGRRIASFSGVWTAVGSTLARAGYEAGVESKCQGILSGLTGTWELIGQDPTAGSYNDLTLTFTRRYQEIKQGQLGAGDSSSIVMQQLRVSVRTHSERMGYGSPPQPGGYGNPGTQGQAFPLIEVYGSYSAWVPFSAATGVSALVGIYGSVRPFLIAQMQAAASGRGFALADERPEYDPDNGRISVSLVGMIVPASGIVGREWSYVEETETGKAPVAVWADDPYRYFVYDGPARRIATVTETVETATGGSGGSGSNGALSGGSSYSGEVFGIGVSGKGGVGGFGFGDLFGNFGFGGETDSTFYGSGVGGQYQPPGGGSGAGGSGDSGAGDTSGLASASFEWIKLRGPVTRLSKYAIGLSSPIVVTRKTTESVYQAIHRATSGSGPSTPGGGSATTPGKSDPPNGAPSREPVPFLS